MNLQLGDEMCSARTPEFRAALDIDDAEIEKRAEPVENLWRRCNDFRLAIRRTAALVDDYPNIFQPQNWFAFSTPSLQEHRDRMPPNELLATITFLSR